MIAALGQIGRDVRHAVAALRRAPVMALVVIGSIAVGIGVNTTVFSWIQARLLTPLPGVERGARFYLIEARSETGGYPGLSWPEYRDLTERLTAFREVIAFRMAPLSVGAADWSERSYGVLVSGNYFSALGLRAQAGRLLEAGDAAAPGGAAVVVVSHRFWQARLAGARDAVGRELRVNDRPFTIVGIAPEDFVGTVMGLTFDLWVPATAVPLLLEGSRELESRGQRGYMALGDLQPGVSRLEGQRDLDRVMRELSAMYPDASATITGEVLPQWQSPRGPQQSLMTALALLQGAMLLVLVVVAGNTANLMLARATVRSREVGVMLALGAGRWRVWSRVLSENFVLTMVGAGAGALLAVWGTNALRAVPLPTPGGLQLSFVTEVDTISLAFAMSLGVLAGLIIGIPPALLLSRINPQASLRSGAAAPGRSTARDVLLALEVALAMVALAVAALFVSSFRESQTTSPGFRQEGLLLATYDLRGRTRSIPASASADFAARLLDRLRAASSIESAALATSVPLDIHGMPSRLFEIEGRARPDGLFDEALTNLVSPGYFATMGIPFVTGADFADLRDASAPLQAVVNEEFVRRFVGSAEPLGRRIDTAGRQYAIVGVVRDSRYNSFGEPPAPFIYLSLRDRPSPMVEIHARARGRSTDAVAAEIRTVVRDLDPSLPVYNVRTMVEHVDGNLVFQRIPARMFVVLGPLLLVLVGVGIYAVVAYGVAGRRQEIGTRLALGATAGRVSSEIVRDTLRTAGPGMAGGLIVALMINPDLTTARASDLGLVAGVAALLLVVSTVASWWPARQAGRIDPLIVLKQE